MDYESILGQLVDGELSKYKIETRDAFAFQQTLRTFGERAHIKKRALRGGAIIYTAANIDE